MISSYSRTGSACEAGITRADDPEQNRPVKILFAALHHGYFRNLESVVEELARRGHQLHLVAERVDSAAGGGTVVDRLAARFPNVTVGMVQGREQDDATFLAGKLRLGLAYLRYLNPPYDQMPALVRRAEERTPLGIVHAARCSLFAALPRRQQMARALDALDRAVPRSAAIDRFLDDQQPDVVLITPLVGVVASSQIDLLRSAAAKQIPTAVCVWSWDHLSSKAIIRDAPGRLFVWNDTQRQEAIEMHGVPGERVVVTGAQCFDRWFDRTPTRERADFCHRVGLPDDRKYLLWVCSALFAGSPSEAELVMKWASHLRASSDANIRKASILIRPHPSRAGEWEGIDWKSLPGVTLYGGNPIDEESRADYFDSLYHSAAVVGLNTSAFIEAGIAGRPVMGILLPEFRANQEGTLHFRYLTEVGGGLLTTARSLDEHERQLTAILGGAAEVVLKRQREFVRAFVRPRGLDVPATPILADAIEQLPMDAAQVTAVGEPSRAASIAWRALLVLQRLPGTRRLFLDEREVRRDAALKENRRRRRAEAFGRRAEQRAEKAARAARMS